MLALQAEWLPHTSRYGRDISGIQSIVKFFSE